MKRSFTFSILLLLVCFSVTVFCQETTKPIITHKERAKYTPEAMDKSVEGKVVLSVTFTADGRVTNIEVINGLPHGLNGQAIEAAKKIKFTPATKNGLPVTTTAQLEFEFSIAGSAGAPDLEVKATSESETKAAPVREVIYEEPKSGNWLTNAQFGSIDEIKGWTKVYVTGTIRERPKIIEALKEYSKLQVVSTIEESEFSLSYRDTEEWISILGRRYYGEIIVVRPVPEKRVWRVVWSVSKVKTPKSAASDFVKALKKVNGDK